VDLELRKISVWKISDIDNLLALPEARKRETCHRFLRW